MSDVTVSMALDKTVLKPVMMGIDKYVDETVNTSEVVALETMSLVSSDEDEKGGDTVVVKLEALAVDVASKVDEVFNGTDKVSTVLDVAEGTATSVDTVVDGSGSWSLEMVFSLGTLAVEVIDEVSITVDIVDIVDATSLEVVDAKLDVDSVLAAKGP